MRPREEFTWAQAESADSLHPRCPTRHYAVREVLARDDAEYNAKHVLLATDSGSLKLKLLKVAVALSSRPSLETDALGWRAAAGAPTVNLTWSCFRTRAHWIRHLQIYGFRTANDTSGNTAAIYR
jgi:hypothetical protein